VNDDARRSAVENLTLALGKYAATEGYGEVLRFAPRRPLGSGRTRAPDVAFRTCLHASADTAAGGNASLVVPDLVAYVINSTDLAVDIVASLLDWLDAGVKEFWEVYPRTPTVYSWRPDRNGSRFRRSDILTAPDLLPGFAAPLGDIFRRPDDPDPPPVQ
jgi:Uma2 family endonuclease